MRISTIIKKVMVILIVIYQFKQKKKPRNAVTITFLGLTV